VKVFDTFSAAAKVFDTFRADTFRADTFAAEEVFDTFCWDTC
jgi:hypothetical protein